MRLFRSIPTTPLEDWVYQKIGGHQKSFDRKAIEDYQLFMLNEVIKRAREKSSFYRQKLTKTPQSLSSLKDLALFPFTTADDIRNSALSLVCVSQSEIQRVVTLDTSGTTGKPKRIYFTKLDQDLTIDFFKYGMSVFTNIDDRVLILLPYETPGSVGDLLAKGLRRLGAKPIPYGLVFDPKEVLETIQDQKATVLVGAPTHVLALARFSQHSIKDYPHHPKKVLLSTDYLSPSIMQAIEAVWGCKVYNHYGMTEMGLGGGVDCQARVGYHYREADLYIEIIDPQTGELLPEGQTGEIVFTTLTRAGMPLIRYRSGDLSRILPKKCPCKTELKTLAYIRSRISSQIVLDQTKDHRLSIADLDDALFKIESIANFSARLIGDLHKSTLELEMVIIPNTKADWRTQVEESLDHIPAIKQTMQINRLSMNINGRIYQPASGGSLAKRIIVDQRSR
jgi:phenylacetate-CoA ligase